MTVPSLDNITSHLEIPLNNPGDKYILVFVRLIPAPAWKRLVDQATEGDQVLYSDHAAAFIDAGVESIGDHENEPVPLDPGDADTIANTYPPSIVNQIVGHIVTRNTVGWLSPKAPTER